MKKIWFGLAALISLVALQGCGGGAGGTASGGSGGSGGTGGTTTPAAKGTALVRVDAVNNTATITPLDPSSRAIFSGAAISLNSIKVNEDAGEVTSRQLAVNVTNNTQAAITGLRFTVSGVTPVTAPVTDDRSNTNVSTYAGNGTTGSLSGPVLSSDVSAPYGIWTDTDGTVYYTTTSGTSIRKISNGVNSLVVSLSGALPYGLTGDFSFLYYCDYTHHVVVRIPKFGTGPSTIIAGTSATPGNVDGAPGTSKLNQPSNLTIDSQGNLWVCDFLNNEIRKITGPAGPTPILSTLTLSGFSISTPYSITDLTLDGTEYLAVGQYSSAAKVYLINRNTGVDLPITGATSTAGATGPANTVGFNIVRGITSLGGIIIVDEAGRQDLKVIYRPQGASATDSTTWIVAALAGTTSTGSADGSGTVATFNTPTGLTFAPDNSLLVADTANNKIRRVVLSNFAELSGAGNSPATGNVAVGTPDTYVANADGNNYPAFVLGSTLNPGASATLNPWTFALSNGVTSFQFVVTVDGQTTYDGILDAVDRATAQGSSQDYMRTLTRPYINHQLFGGKLSDITNNLITHFCFAADGTAYLSCYNFVLRVDTNQNASIIAGGLGNSGAADGSGRAASFSGIDGIACNQDGSVLYVVDNSAVRRITGSGADPNNWFVSTIAGSVANAGNVRGTGVATRFAVPNGVACNAAGDIVYVCDTGNHYISVVTPTEGNDPSLASSWFSSNIAGNGTDGYTDGSFSKIGNVTGIALGPTGDLYFADSSNFRIRKVSATVVSTVAGSGSSTPVDGTATAAGMTPIYLTVSKTGYVYFNDTGTSIRRVDPAGNVRTIASAAGAAGDGNCATFSTREAFDLGVSPTGVLWFQCDLDLRTIERIVGD